MTTQTVLVETEKQKQQDEEQWKSYMADAMKMLVFMTAHPSQHDMSVHNIGSVQHSLAMALKLRDEGTL